MPEWYSYTLTNHLWKPTFAKKWFPFNGYGFPLNGNGFPLHGNFGQNLKSCLQPKNFEFFSKLHVQGSIIGQPNSTNFSEEFGAN
jgi:hypothetical protein